MTQSTAVQRAVAKYDKENIKGFYIKLHKEKDKDIIDKLETVDSKQSYIKGLIRDDILDMPSDEVIEILDTIPTVGKQVDALEIARKKLKYIENIKAEYIEFKVNIDLLKEMKNRQIEGGSFYRALNNAIEILETLLR